MPYLFANLICDDGAIEGEEFVNNYGILQRWSCDIISKASVKFTCFGFLERARGWNGIMSLMYTILAGSSHASITIV